jgi:drug/metabolite transporter (DMT)-like permease
VAVLGALISAVSAVFIKKLMATEAPVTVLFYFGMFMTLITAAPLPFVWVTPTLGELAYLLLLGITASVAQSCFIRAYRAADATLVAPFDYLQLVSATIIGFIAFGALPGVWTWLGAGIIVAANLWLTLSERRAARPPRG